MSNIGSSKIGEMYVGSTKIAQAYVGSTLVFQLHAAGYDSYKVHLTWDSNDNFNMAGLHIDGVQASSRQVTSLRYYNGGWRDAPPNDITAAIKWDNNDNGKSFYGTAIDINFTADNMPASVQIKTGTWYGGGSMKVTMHVAGVKDGVETDLGYTQQTNDANLIYTVNIT